MDYTVVVVKTQQEMDALPDRFENFTQIQIRSSDESAIIVRKALENSSVTARDNSSVTAWGNSSVIAYDNSSVTACGNSSVTAWDNSSVVAYDNSSVVACGSSSVEAYDNSSVVACGNSSVTAWENSSVDAWDSSSVTACDNSSVMAHNNSSVVACGSSSVEAYNNSSVTAHNNSSVVACGNSSVEAYDNSSVEAYDNSSVVAHGNSIVRIFSPIKLTLKQSSTGVCIGCKADLTHKDDTATYIEKQVATYSKDIFLDIYSKNIQPDGRVLLYKSVRKENRTDFHTGTIKYEGIVRPKRWDPDEKRQCGDGLHLSPTPAYALAYKHGKILKCLVKQEDFVVYPNDISKVRCREVEVIEGK